MRKMRRSHHLATPPPPWHARAMAALIDDDKRAQRKARAIASDIYLYNKAKIEEALKNDSFFEDMSEFITEGRDLFRSSVTPELFKKNYYDRAIVDRVIKPMAGVDTPIGQRAAGRPVSPPPARPP